MSLLYKWNFNNIITRDVFCFLKSGFQRAFFYDIVMIAPISKQPYLWYAVYTKSRAEKKVHSALVDRGIECYLPLIKVRRQWSDRVKMVEEPLLRGYLFVKVCNKEYYNVLGVPGAIRYVSFEGKPAIIPEVQIDDLKAFMRCSQCDVEITTDHIKRGDIVRITSGPLADVSGEVVEIKGNKRILLRFGSLGYCVHAQLETNEIEVVEKATGNNL